VTTKRQCSECGKDMGQEILKPGHLFYWPRCDKKTCSPRCRKRRSRRHGNPHPVNLQ